MCDRVKGVNVDLSAVVFSPCRAEQYREKQTMLSETETAHTHDRIIIITPVSAGPPDCCGSEWSVSGC